MLVDERRLPRGIGGNGRGSPSTLACRFGAVAACRQLPVGFCTACVVLARLASLGKTVSTCSLQSHNFLLSRLIDPRVMKLRELFVIVWSRFRVIVSIGIPDSNIILTLSIMLQRVRLWDYYWIRPKETLRESRNNRARTVVRVRLNSCKRTGAIRNRTDLKTQSGSWRIDITGDDTVSLRSIEQIDSW